MRPPFHCPLLALFQYISCYSLSMEDQIQAYIPIMFQYISCYSLSDGCKRSLRSVDGFNTSHVTLYRHIIHDITNIRTGFNTSHVTLYLNGQPHIFCFSEFQYISCYSLSTSWDLIRFSYCRLNTSHVTLYQRRVEEFIPVVLRFNTSHVTLYLNIGKPRV